VTRVAKVDGAATQFVSQTDSRFEVNEEVFFKSFSARTLLACVSEFK
jgi:hypothetical protein